MRLAGMLFLLCAMPALGAVAPEAGARAREGLTAFDEGRLLDAERAWTLALRARPEYLTAKIPLLIRTGRSAEALDLARRLHELAPDDPAVLELVARAHRAAGDPDRALALLRHAHELAPDLPGPRLALAAEALDRDAPDEAATLLEPLTLESGPTPTILRARVDLARNAASDAARRLAGACEADPSDITVLLWLARARRLAGDVGSARETLRRARALVPEDPALHLESLRLDVLESGRNEADLRAELRDLMTCDDPVTAREARMLLVDRLEAGGGAEEGLALLSEDLAAPGASPPDRRDLLLRASDLAMAMAREREGRGAREKADLAFARAVDLLQQALSLDPTHGPTRTRLTTRHIELGEHYAEVARASSNPPLVSQLYGYAIYNLERAIELDPHSENRAHEALGRIHNMLQRHEDAVDHFARIKNELGNFVESIYSYGDSCLKTRKLLEASMAFRRVIQIRPDHARAHRDLGLTSWLLKAYPRAEDSFAEAVRLDPTLPVAWYYLAQLRLRRKAWDDAIEAFRRVGTLARTTKDKEVERLAIESRHLLEEIPSRRAADRTLRDLGGTPREDETARRARPAPEDGPP